VEFCILFELLLLAIMLYLPREKSSVYCWIAAYLVFGLFVTLFNIVFVGKLDKALPPTASIERSLLLFIINAAEIVVAFAIFYRHASGYSADEAFFNSLLVFGTIGYPAQGNHYIVASQIALDFVFLAIFLSAFVGRLSAFNRMSEASQANGQLKGE